MVKDIGAGRAGPHPPVRARRHPSPAILTAALAVLFGGILTAFLVLAEYRGWLPRESDPSPDLTRARRLEVVAPGAYEQLLLGLRVHHYRAQPRGVATYRDFYLDTDALELLRRGYSCRFRNRLDGAAGERFSIHIEQESRFASAQARRRTITLALPDSLGDLVVRGDWGLALYGALGLPRGNQVQGLLDEVGVAPERLRPRLVGELRRERFDVTDKGQTWFLMDREMWVFRGLPDSTRSRPLHLDDVALDVRLSRNDPELLRRVRTLDSFLRMLHGVRIVREAPHERAMAALAAR